MADYTDVKPTRELVQQRIQDVNTILTQAVAGLLGFLQGLAGSPVADLPYVSAEQQTFTPDHITVDVQHEPHEPNIDEELTKIKDLQLGISDGWTVDTREITIQTVAVPDFTDIPPTITMPPDPAVFSKDAPEDPSIEPVTTPDVPDINFPTVPSLVDVTIPDLPSISIPNFTGIIPVALPYDTLIPFEYTEQEYESTLLDAVKLKLANDIENGATGVGPIVEADIWNRQSERDEIALTEAIDDLISTWSSRSFPLPNGILVAQIDELTEKHYNDRIDRSREIAIAQADLAQKNTQFSVTSAIQTEQILIQHFNNVADRALKSAISTVELGVAILKAKIDFYNSELERYKVQAQVYESEIRAESLKIEIAKALLEGAKIRGDLRRQDIEIYTAQVQAQGLIIDTYKTRMEAAKIRLSIEQQKVDMYRSRIEAFSALIGSKTAEYGLYRARIDGELAKMKVFEDQVGAFTAIVGAKKAEADVNIAQANANIAIRNYELGVADLLLKKYETETKIALSKVDYLIKKYGMDSEVFKVDIGRAEADARLEHDRATIVADINRGNIQVNLQAATSNLQAFMQAAGINVEALKAGAQYFAALASSAMQAINASMSLSSSYGASDSNGVSYGYSGSYDEQPDTSLPAPKTSTP